MAFVGSRVTVTTTATAVISADADGASATVTNKGSAAVDLGGSDVASGSGYELAAGASVSADLDPSERLYAVTASGTVALHVLRNRS